MTARARKRVAAAEEGDDRSRPRRRLGAGERERCIVAVATEFFAEHGFAGSTRDLARAMGVTQALLYRYFPSKEALIARVFESVFDARWDAGWSALLTDRRRTLADRLTAFYLDYVQRGSAVSHRLWMRAHLEGRPLVGRYSAQLTRRILRPMVGELRHEASCPDFARVPMMRGEREAAMVLHGSLFFVNVRRHLYRMPMGGEIDDLIALHVRVALPGVLAEIARLHRPGADPALTVRLLAGSGA